MRRLLIALAGLALPFAAAQASTEAMNRAVVKKLSQQPDLLFQNLLELAFWMADTPADAPWRGEVFKRFAAALVSPSQFPVLREWAMAALVTTRDHNATFILRQALRSLDPNIRRLGCIGLGAFGDTEAIRDLRPMMEDDDLDVQIAASLALAAIGTERAVELLAGGLYDGHESLRQAVAESLAAFPAPGYALLHEAVLAEDMMVRRATVFGLARVGTLWALTDLYQRMLDDEQWYVRSAAEQALARTSAIGPVAARAHPPVETLEWVNEWVAEQGQQAAPGEDARHMLINMLRSGGQGYRIASAHTLGNIGGLLVQGGNNCTCVTVKAKFGPGITNLPDGRPDNLGNLHITFGGDLPHHQYQSGCNRSLTSHPGCRVLRQDGIQHRIGDLITNLIRMAFRDRF